MRTKLRQVTNGRGVGTIGTNSSKDPRMNVLPAFSPPASGAIRCLAAAAFLIAVAAGCKPHSPLEPQAAETHGVELGAPSETPAPAEPRPATAPPSGEPAPVVFPEPVAPEPTATPGQASPAASAAPGAQGTAAPAKPRKPMIAEGMIALTAGQSAEIAPGTELRFDKVVSDSRCPANVQCVWAGEVKIALTLSSPEGKASIELSQSTSPKAAAQSFQIELTGYGPCASASQSTRECASLHFTPVELR